MDGWSRPRPGPGALGLQCEPRGRVHRAELPAQLGNWALLDSGWPGESGTGAVYTNPCQQGNDHQTWNIIYLYHADWDVVRIQNKATELCLFSYGLGMYAGQCNASAYGAWYGQGSGWGKVRLMNYETINCLDSNYSGSVYGHACNNGGYQLWKLGY
ncbi:hypothetical protein GCM10023083_41220 [Streptomyces phyllanthi]